MHECRYCEKPLKRLYPDTAYELQWAHTSFEDARDCPSASEMAKWPIPALPSWTRS